MEYKKFDFHFKIYISQFRTLKKLLQFFKDVLMYLNSLNFLDITFLNH